VTCIPLYVGTWMNAEVRLHGHITYPIRSDFMADVDAKEDPVAPHRVVWTLLKVTIGADPRKYLLCPGDRGCHRRIAFDIIRSKRAAIPTMAMDQVPVCLHGVSGS
jgi:hypothetical protein